ncbi:type II toxin-antitoxin system Phd/YefM family antitoxin [Saccharomonospora iraqiensis]|uniref:type II toxin-antitoxin system Phd/YefM family antitoxin n=1 Tax=Saccharomonospora iraqiensis TaxID=52698 RepID=UPI00047A6D30|nr:type II toxin-antitoxin system prevent-host-death family antitoxin [Saccharomonospora iraqiensis]
MERIGVRELRQNASRYLARVRMGETVEVTDRGELVALLAPPHRTTAARDRLIAQGTLIPAANPDGLRHLPEPPPASGARSTQSVLDELREDRL